VIARAGGVLGNGTHAVTVDRTLLTTRSVEFDALVVGGGTAVKPFTDQLAAAVGLHRAWDRAPAVMASAVPPSWHPDNPPNGSTV
jgi:hypothetical protein